MVYSRATQNNNFSKRNATWKHDFSFNYVHPDADVCCWFGAVTSSIERTHTKPFQPVNTLVQTCKYQLVLNSLIFITFFLSFSHFHCYYYHYYYNC